MKGGNEGTKKTARKRGLEEDQDDQAQGDVSNDPQTSSSSKTPDDRTSSSSKTPDSIKPKKKMR
jgi:hypothetical protein